MKGMMSGADGYTALELLTRSCRSSTRCLYWLCLDQYQTASMTALEVQECIGAVGKIFPDNGACVGMVDELVGAGLWRVVSDDDVPSFQFTPLNIGEPWRTGVYFMRAGRRGAIKIGWTTSLSSRLATLQTGNAEPLEVIGWMRGGPKLERAMHRLFESHRMTGEWFRPAQEILDFVAEIGGVR